MTTQTQHAQSLQAAREILREVCGLAEVPDSIRDRAQSTLQRLRPPRRLDRHEAQSGLTWWIQLESAGAASDELAAALKDHRSPAAWTAVVHTRSAAGKESIEALICFARDEHSMRDALAERVGSHVANVAAVVRGIGANEVTHRVITPDALRMAEELIRRREPFSLEARLEYYRR